MVSPKVWDFSRLASLLVLLCLSSCERPVKTGKYVYKTAQQQSEIELLAGGRFRETIHYFSTGQKFEKTGSWQRQNSGLLFDGFLYSIDTEKLRTLNPPKEYGSSPAEIHGDILIFSEDAGYWFKLQK